MTGSLIFTIVNDSTLLVDVISRIVGFAFLSAGTAAIVAICFRWYSGDAVPDGIAILVGVSGVAIWLNTKSALGDAIIGTTPLLDPGTAIYTVSAFFVSAVAADGGRRIGDHLVTHVVLPGSTRTVEDVSDLLRSAGRSISVEIPEQIHDIDGYDPVDQQTKDDLAGQTLVFPRRLSADALCERFISRLQRDYGIGHIDVECSADRSIEYLAVGSKPAGIGPTIGPGTVAIALRCDPPPEASPGDAVSVWSIEGDHSQRVCRGELRGVAGDVATIAIDAEAPQIDSEETYRLVTRPGTSDAGREFVSLLRAAPETVLSIAVSVDSPLIDATTGSLPVVVIAIERAGEQIALPDDDTKLQSDDVIYALGRPDVIRRLGEHHELATSSPIS